MTHGDLKVRLVGEFLQPLFVTTGSGSVTAAAVSLDHQPFCPGIVFPVSLPPVAEGIRGEVWNVFRCRHADVPGVALGIIDSVRRDTPFGIRRKVVVVDLLALATPRLAVVFELADQLFLLRIDTDPRVARFAKRFTLSGNVAELLVAFGMMLAGVQHFAMAPQPQLLIAQEPTDGGGTRAVIKFLRKAAQSGPHPLFVRARIARRFRFDAC